MLVPGAVPTVIYGLSVQLRSQGFDPQPQGPGTGNARIVTVQVNGADTPVSCTVADAATACESGAASTTAGPGATINLKIQTVDGEPQAEGIGGPILLFGYRTRPATP
jgi:hypothetical protein